MGRVASSVDNSIIESFWSTMQRELLDQDGQQGVDELGRAIFEWIEAWSNPRRHTSLGMLSPVEFKATHTAATLAAFSPHQPCPVNGSCSWRRVLEHGGSPGVVVMLTAARCHRSAALRGRLSTSPTKGWSSTPGRCMRLGG